MNYLSLLLYAVLAIFLKDRTDFALFFLIYTAIFLSYYWQNFKLNNAWWIWAIAFRLPFIVSIPYLSDDFYRFIWDGLLQNQGINPYLHLPSEISNQISQLGIYEKLNSQKYYSVYPPFNQFLFGLSTYFSPQSLIGQVVGLRILLWFFEFGTIWLLQQTLKTRENISLFALNPLLILEVTGNLHFEIVIVFFVLLAYYIYKKFPKVWYASAISYGLAISVKLIPLLLLPLLFFRLKRSLFIALALLVFLLSFLPFWDQAMPVNFLQSVNLFFSRFEFNASVYYLLRELGYLTVGYNIIHLAGMGLKILSGLLILYISYRTKDFGKAILAVLFVYLASATTVHPWYLIPLIATTCFTNIRFVIIWSYLVMLSYQAYSQNVFQENLWIVTLEYSLLAIYILYESKKGVLKLW